jgi:hypothetical protein
MKTMAETAAVNGRDEANMIYEMYQISQYADGSVLNCLLTDINPQATFTAQEVVDGKFVINADNPLGAKLAKTIMRDVKRNAEKALKAKAKGLGQTTSANVTQP